MTKQLLVPDPDQVYDHRGEPLDGSPRCIEVGNGNGQPPARKKRRGTAPWSDEEIVERINRWAEMFGDPPSGNDWHPVKLREMIANLRDKLDELERKQAAFQDSDFPGASTVQERFGSWSAALVAAGFAPRERGKARSSERLTADQAKAIRKTLRIPAEPKAKR